VDDVELPIGVDPAQPEPLPRVLRAGVDPQRPAGRVHLEALAERLPHRRRLERAGLFDGPLPFDRSSRAAWIISIALRNCLWPRGR